MALRSALAFLLLVTLFDVPSITAGPGFDYLMLGLMWPGAYCSQTKAGCCKPTTGFPAKDFLISSFATYNETTNKAITKCTRDPFTINDLIDLNDQLVAYWSNIKCPSNNGLSSWKKAWKSYGVCSNLTVNGYFNAALAARDKANVLEILANKGIYPGDGLYNLMDVKSAIKESLGVTPGIQCSQSPKGLYQIYQIFLCFDSNGNVRDCPVFPSYTCSSYVQFLPFEYSMLKSSISSTDVGNGVSSLLKMPASDQ